MVIASICMLTASRGQRGVHCFGSVHYERCFTELIGGKLLFKESAGNIPLALIVCWAMRTSKSVWGWHHSDRVQFKFF